MKKIFLMFLISSVFFCPDLSESKEKMIIGWLESVRVYPGNLRLRAKMDTGAKSSSINAVNLKRFKRNGEDWVRFDLESRNKRKNTVYEALIEKKIVRVVKIKRRGGGTEERVVVKMEICINGLLKEINMNLYDRSNFNYQVLIGREDLVNDFIVDPSETFTGKPKCRIPVEIEN